MGYFDDRSLLRQVVGDRLTGLSGPRALLIMAAHPVAFEGFFAHTGALDDPYARLERTARVMNAVAFGSREDADRATRRVRAMHRNVTGSLSEPAGRFPAGTPYRADDPELLLWILAALAESAMLVYDKYVRRLSEAERDDLWQDYRIVGRQFGLRPRDMPQDADAFAAYMDGMYASGDLVVTDAARELAIDIVLSPPVSLPLRPVLELVNQITVGLLPRDLRRQYGFSWDPAALGRAARRRRVRPPRARPRAPGPLPDDPGQPVGTPSIRRLIPSGLSSRSSGGSAASGASWNATGRVKRWTAVMPTDVWSGLVVAGNGPPWCMPKVTATPVGKPLKITRPARSPSAVTTAATSSSGSACTEPVSWPSTRSSAASSSSSEP